MITNQIIELGLIWSDPEFKAILEMSFITDDRSGAFSYQSTGDTYEFRFTNGENWSSSKGRLESPAAK